MSTSPNPQFAKRVGYHQGLPVYMPTGPGVELIHVPTSTLVNGRYPAYLSMYDGIRGGQWIDGLPIWYVDPSENILTSTMWLPGSGSGIGSTLVACCGSCGSNDPAFGLIGANAPGYYLAKQVDFQCGRPVYAGVCCSGQNTQDPLVYVTLLSDLCITNATISFGGYPTVKQFQRVLVPKSWIVSRYSGSVTNCPTGFDGLGCGSLSFGSYTSGSGSNPASQHARYSCPHRLLRHAGHLAEELGYSARALRVSGGEPVLPGAGLALLRGDRVGSHRTLHKQSQHHDPRAGGGRDGELQLRSQQHRPIQHTHMGRHTE